MKKLKVYFLTAALIAGEGLISNQVYAENLGLIHVDSTTINDRFEAKRGEPSNVSVVSGEKVDSSHTESIKQILDGIPGITTELQNEDSLKIHIRGVENQRFMGEKPGVAVVIDGVPVFERTGRVNINLDDIESIKVVKGGASYLFGEDALAGAVIITTKHGAKMAGYKLSAEGGSFGYKRGLAQTGFSNDVMSGHIQVSHRGGNGYHFQSDYRADYLNGKLQGYLNDSSDLTFGWSLAKRKKDSHGTVTGVTQAATDPTSIQGRDFARKFDVNLGKFYLTYANDISDTSNLMLNLYQYGDHTKFLSSPIKYSATGSAVTDINAYANDNDYKQIQRGFKGEWRNAGETVAWMGGVDLRDNSFKNHVVVLQDHKRSPSRRSRVIKAGTITADNKTKERVYAGYGELKYKLFQSLTLTANGRFDHIGLDFNDYLPAASAPFLSKSFNVTSWRGGFTYDLSDSASIYSNVSTGFRAPTIQQLFAGTISPTGGTSANPNLKPERAINYEIGLRGKFPELAGLDWDVDVFRINRNNFILDVAGQYNFATSATRQYQNIGGMRSQGVEVALKTDQQRMFSASLAYTYLNAKYTRYDNFGLVLGNPFSPRPGAHRIVNFNNAGKRIPRTPRHKLFLAANIRPFTGFKLTTEVNAQSSYFADEINRVKIGGQTVFNLLANYDFSFGDNNTVQISLFGRVDNLLDRTYYNTARGFRDSNNDFIYNAEDVSLVVNPGRRWTAGLTAKF